MKRKRFSLSLIEEDENELTDVRLNETKIWGHREVIQRLQSTGYVKDELYQLYTENLLAPPFLNKKLNWSEVEDEFFCLKFNDSFDLKETTFEASKTGFSRKKEMGYFPNPLIDIGASKVDCNFGPSLRETSDLKCQFNCQPQVLLKSLAIDKMPTNPKKLALCTVNSYKSQSSEKANENNSMRVESPQSICEIQVNPSSENGSKKSLQIHIQCVVNKKPKYSIRKLKNQRKLRKGKLFQPRKQFSKSFHSRKSKKKRRIFKTTLRLSIGNIHNDQIMGQEANFGPNALPLQEKIPLNTSQTSVTSEKLNLSYSDERQSQQEIFGKSSLGDSPDLPLSTPEYDIFERRVEQTEEIFVCLDSDSGGGTVFIEQGDLTNQEAQILSRAVKESVQISIESSETESFNSNSIDQIPVPEESTDTETHHCLSESTSEIEIITGQTIPIPEHSLNSEPLVQPDDQTEEPKQRVPEKPTMNEAKPDLLCELINSSETLKSGNDSSPFTKVSLESPAIKTDVPSNTGTKNILRSQKNALNLSTLEDNVQILNPEVTLLNLPITAAHDNTATKRKRKLVPKDVIGSPEKMPRALRKSTHQLVKDIANDPSIKSQSQEQLGILPSPRVQIKKPRLETTTDHCINTTSNLDVPDRHHHSGPSLNFFNGNSEAETLLEGPKVPSSDKETRISPEVPKTRIEKVTSSFDPNEMSEATIFYANRIIQMYSVHDFPSCECEQTKRIRSDRNLKDSKKGNAAFRFCLDCIIFEEAITTEKVDMFSSGSSYICSICHFETSNKASLLDHVAIRHSDVIFRCPSCDFHADFDFLLKCHWDQNHGNILSL